MNEDINTIRDVLLDKMQHEVNADKINALLALRRLEKRLEEQKPVYLSVEQTRGTITGPMEPPLHNPKPESEPVALGTIYYGDEQGKGWECPAAPNRELARICRGEVPYTRIEWHPALPKDPYRDPINDADPQKVGKVRQAWIKWRREIVDPIRKEQA